MSLASPPAGGMTDPSFLPGISSGLDSTGWQWQAPSALSHQEAVPHVEGAPLPPWLTKTQPTKTFESQPCSEPQPCLEENKTASTRGIFSAKDITYAAQFAPSLYEARGLRSTLNEQKTLGSTHSIRGFLNGLKNCIIPEDIEKLAVSLSMDLGSAPVCSKLAFEHMLQIGSTLSMQIQFLENPNLNVPAARNPITFLLWYAKQEANEDDKSLLHHWISRQVSRGAWRGEELSLLLKSIFGVNGTMEEENNHCSFSRSIFEGLSSSTVFKVHDVAGTALNTLLQSVSPSSMSQNGELLGIEIIERSSTSQLQKMGPGITTFLKKCLLPKNQHQKVQDFDRNIATKLLKLLQRTSVRIEVMSIAGATSALLMCHEYASVSRSNLLKNFNAWWSLLLEHGMLKSFAGHDNRYEVERILAHGNIDILATYLRLLDDGEKCCFLLRNWFIPEISKRACQIGKTQHIENEFRHELTLPRARLSPFVTMIQSLGLNLPVNSKWMSPLFSLLLQLGRSRTILEIVDFRKVLGLRISTLAIVYAISENAKSQPYVSYRLFKANPGIPLEVCPVVAEIIIQNPRFDPSTAHLYRRNRQKNLSSCKVFVPEPRNIFARFSYDCPRGEHHKIRNYRASLLDRMALAYAQALHLSSQAAYRNVYRCYRLHVWYRLGPVSIDMSRALTIAGALRPLQEGKIVTATRIRWILKMVKVVEGEEIARGVDELYYKWEMEVVLKTKRRKAWERREAKMGFTIPRPERKRLRGKTLTAWTDGRRNARNGRTGRYKSY
ncbi:hypothetical protein MMC07_000154 [Pseudocyphellaria aurata]|nr:hypothetical protein [Pseudocyphellaria aurata]